MLLLKIISFGIKHIEIFGVRKFLYLYIKLNGFFKYCSLSYSLNCRRAILEGKVFFQHL